MQIDEGTPEMGTCIAFHWRHDVPGAQLAHQLRFNRMQTSVDPRDEWLPALARFVCHILVDEIPQQGLGELYESLNDMYQFYLEQPAQPQAALPSVRRIDATVGGRMERPDFHLESDED